MRGSPESAGGLRSALYEGLRVVVGVVSALFLPVRTRGLEHVPSSGGVILVANHPSFLDPFLIGLRLQRRPAYLVLHNYVTMPVVGRFIRFFGGMPVGHRPAAGLLREARRLLEAGGSLEVFPEGGRSDAGGLLPFRRGFARLAREAAVPVIPVAIVGAEQVWPPGQRLPRPGRVEVIFGEPLRADSRRDLPVAEAGRVDREFAALLQRRILALAGGRLRSLSDQPRRRSGAAPGVGAV